MTDEVKQSVDSVRAAESATDATFRGSPPFRDASHYIASAEYNPDGREFEREQQVELDRLIGQLNNEWRRIQLEEAGNVQLFSESKIASGDYRTAALDAPLQRNPAAHATRAVVGPDGVVKVVDIFPGECAAVDDSVVLKSDVLEQGKKLIRQWIADH